MLAEPDEAAVVQSAQWCPGTWTGRITPSKSLDTLRRLHHHGLVDFREHTAVLGITGLAPEVPAAVAAELSPYTARLLAMLDVREPRPGRGPGPIGAIRLGSLER